MVGIHNFSIHKLNEKIARSLPYKGRVVDLGCGTAPYKSIILEVADEYIGVDWKNSCHDQTNVDLFFDLCDRFLIADNYADTIVSFQVMEHLPEPNIFLSECYRILKSGGSIFMVVPFMWRVHESPCDYYRYTRFGLEHMFSKNGFDDIVSRENTGFWQMWILKFNYHTHRFAKGPFKYLWFAIWWLGQTAAVFLDRYDKDITECASYTIIAGKTA